MSKKAESQNLGGDEEEEEDYETLCGVVVIGAPGTGKTTFTNAL
jgi:predicted PilT family ATPase